MPWDQAIERYYNPSQSGILAREKKALERFFGDPAAVLHSDFRAAIAKLGLPANVSLTPGAVLPALTPIPVAGFERLDVDGNGAISRTEYLSGRQRMFRAGPGSDNRRAVASSRLDRQFRRADWNGDGQISGDELIGVRNPRF